MRLYFLNGPRTGESIEVTPPGISIGRETDNNVQLLVRGVSRYHANIELNPAGKWRISDLGSTNGTKLNGNPLTVQTLLKEGDRIMIGDQLLRFGEETPESPAPEKAEAETPEESAGTKKKPQVIFRTGGTASGEKTPSVEKTPSAPPETKAEAELKTVKEMPLPKKETVSVPKIDDLFGNKKEKKGKEAETPEDHKKKRLHNLMFLLLVVILICGTLAVFVILPQFNNVPKKNALPASLADRNPFFLEYEKLVIARDNVFRFALKIEDGSALFMLDDLKHRRHFVRKYAKVNPEFLKELFQSVRSTDFMKLEQEHASPPSDGIDERRTLAIGYGPNLNRIEIRNNSAQTSFEKVESAIDQFAKSYDLQTVSIPAEDMRAEAEKAYQKAEDLFTNYQARPENLRNAVIRYQLAIEFYEQFDPPPKELAVAKRHLKDAENILKKIISDTETNVNILYRRKQYLEAAEECRKLMEYLEPESKQYKNARAYKVKLEKLASSKK